jgi:hypothetical protein
MTQSSRPTNVSTNFTPEDEDYEQPGFPAEAGNEYAAGGGVADAGTYRTTGRTPSSDKGGVMGDTLLSQTEELRRRWASVQVSFVDSPRDAVRDADALVSEVIDDLVTGFRAQRERLEMQWAGGNEASTEELRGALQRYRDFFERLVQV